MVWPSIQLIKTKKYNLNIFNPISDLVLQVLQQASSETSESKSVNEQLQSLQAEVVHLAQNYSRSSVSKAD